MNSLIKYCLLQCTSVKILRPYFIKYLSYHHHQRKNKKVLLSCGLQALCCLSQMQMFVRPNSKSHCGFGLKISGLVVSIYCSFLLSPTTSSPVSIQPLLYSWSNSLLLQMLMIKNATNVYDRKVLHCKAYDRKKANTGEDKNRIFAI